MSEALGRPVGVFGGTFDPVHYGHLRLAEEAVDGLGLDRVRWIPAGQPTLRAAPRVGATARLAMVRMAVAGNPRFEVDGAEAEADRPSYTVPTLERLREEGVCGARCPLVLLLGEDAFRGLTRWHRWADLFDLAHLAIAHRPGHAADTEGLPEALTTALRQRFCADPAVLRAQPAGAIIRFAMTPLDISATRIRALLSTGESARYLLPDGVLDYIHHNRHYMER